MDTYYASVQYPFRNNLTKYRKAAGLSQADLARQAQCSRLTVYRHETGRRGISSVQLAAYCSVLGCTPNDLLSVDESEVA